MKTEALPDSIQEQLPIRYSISKEEFKLAPRNISTYKPGDKVIRENFINFLIHSFAISRGQSGVQTLFILWLHLKENFDCFSTFDNFHEAGGWDILSDDEKKEFIRRLSGVAKHKNILAKNLNEKLSETDNATLITAIKMEIDTLVDIIKDDPVGLLQIEANKIRSCNTYSEFLLVANNEIESLRIRKS